MKNSKVLIAAALSLSLWEGAALAQNIKIAESVIIDGKHSLQSCEEINKTQPIDTINEIVKLELLSLISERNNENIHGSEKIINGNYNQEIKASSSGYVSTKNIQTRIILYLNKEYLCAYTNIKRN